MKDLRVIAAVLCVGLLLIASAGCSTRDPCDQEKLSVEGVLETFFTSLALDEVRAKVFHVRHDDAWEDGRIDKVELELSVVPGCTLNIVAAGCVDGQGRLPITQATLVTGVGAPACPGLASAKTYLKESAPIGTLQVEDAQVPGRDRATVCFSTRMTLQLEGNLHPPGADDPLQILSSTITIQGDFLSTGIAADLSSCGYATGDVVVVGDVGGSGGDVRGGDDGGANTDTATEVIPGQPVVELTIECPECTTDATVRLNGSAGDTAGMPEYVFVFHDPEFPLKSTLGQAKDPAGVTFPWPPGIVTFQAYQDTIPGGSVAEPGEPLSSPVTVTLALEQTTDLMLVIDASGETTVTCTAGEWFCIDLETAAECNDEGDYYEELVCPFGNKCSEISGMCEAMVCAPGSLECATPASWHKCLPSGTGWSLVTDCAEGKICANGGCMSEDCLSQVVFLVDTSQSMDPHWDAVAASIEALTGNNPLAYMGLATFPEGGTICEMPQTFKVPFAAGAGSEVADWFSEKKASGQTPLLEAMNQMAAALPETFPGGGALVVLSDGADTCAYPAMSYEEREALIVEELGAATAGLFSDHGIKTVVVGYQYQGNPDQLNAIASNGGTGMETYTEAGNEQELTMALVAIVDDLKECFE